MAMVQPISCFRGMLMTVSLMGLAATAAERAPQPSFVADFDHGLDGRDRAGHAVRPLTAHNTAFAPGLHGKALVADSAKLVYPATVCPRDAGTVLVLVSPLKNGLGKAWSAFCGPAEKWGGLGIPRLWRWNGQPRFDMDGGARAITAGMPGNLPWKVGTWHLFAGTWDRTKGRVAMYLDGRLIGSKTVDPWKPEAAKGFAVGWAWHIDNRTFDWGRCLIDSITIYDRALPLLALAREARRLGIYPQPPIQVPPNAAWRNSLHPTGEPGPELALATHGTTSYTVILPAQPTTMEVKAALELTEWLHVMTGAKFPIAAETDLSSGPVISIGRTQRLAAAKPRGWDRDLGREGIGIGTADRDLFLWGGSGRGIIHAVAALLEEDLGCRWYARNTATIPRKTSLRFRPVPRIFVPVLEIRDPYYWDAFDATWSLHNRTNAPNARVPDAFGGRVHYAGGFFVHTFQRLVPPKTYFKTHPEYFSEIGGKRVPRQLCLTNPDVLRITIDKVRQTLRADPTARLISVSPNDGTGYCECARCKAIDEAEGTHAGTLLRFVNAVADAIGKEFPDVKISTLAYLGTVQPPKTIRPRDNVVIRLCTDRHAWSHEFEFVTETDEFSGAMKAWSKIGASLTIWDYTTNFSHYSLPFPNLPLVTQNMRWMIRHNARGIMLQGAYQSPGSARGPLRSWVWAKQLWNPTWNTRDLIRDFTYGFYGEAAKPMQQYNELLWRLWEREYMGALREAGGIRFPPDAKFFTVDFAQRATALFAEAEARARNPEVKKRVRLAKFSLLYLKLARGPGFLPGENYEALCDEFANIAREHHITHLWEGDWSRKDQVARKLAYWRGLSQARALKLEAVRIGPDCMFQPDPNDAGEKEGWFKPAFADLGWSRIRCGEAGGWNQQGFPNLTGVAWYRIRFQVPKDFGNNRTIRIFVGSADEDAVFFLNGHKVFEHTCASTHMTPEQIWNKAFMFDPGEQLKRGAENLLAVRVFNRQAMGGLWKPLYLIAGKELPKPDLVLEALRHSSPK